MSRSVTTEDGHAVIRIPFEDVHGLRVALAECPCRSTKSIATAEIRKALLRALGKVVAK